jgi:hypothetical protein
VPSIKESITDERSERPIDGGADAKRSGEARGAAGREIDECFSAHDMNRDGKNPPGKVKGHDTE